LERAPGKKGRKGKGPREGVWLTERSQPASVGQLSLPGAQVRQLHCRKDNGDHCDVFKARGLL
jgi:hypothetical protein